MNRHYRRLAEKQARSKQRPRRTMILGANGNGNAYFAAKVAAILKKYDKE